MHEMSWWSWSWSWRSVNSSSSPVLHFTRMSLFLVLFLLFSSLSFFVVDGIGDDSENDVNEVIPLEKETNTMSWDGSDTTSTLRTIELSVPQNNSSNDNGNRTRDTETTSTSASGLVEMSTTNARSDGESFEENRNYSSTRNQNFSNIYTLKNLDWQWKWDVESERDLAAGLATTGIISDGRMSSVFLSHGVLGRFVFLNDKIRGNWVSFTVTPCTSILYWSIKFLQFNDSNPKFALKKSRLLKTFRTDLAVEYNETSIHPGFYILEIRPVHGDTYVHFYVTTVPFDHPIGVPASSVFPQIQDGTNERSSTYNFIPVKRRGIISVKKLRGGRVSVRWERSPMNPQITQYCIIVNTRKDYSSLCGAQGERYGVLPPDLMHLPYYYYKHYTNNKRMTMTNSDTNNNNNNNNTRNHFGTLRGRENDSDNSEGKTQTQSQIKAKKVSEDIIIGCLANRKRRNHVLHNLQDGQLYYINIFVKNILTNLSYPYVRTTYKYKLLKSTGENILRDSKAIRVSLPGNCEDIEAGTKTILKFYLSKPCTDLTMYAMPCGGGPITYQVFNANRCVYQSEEVTNLDVIKIVGPSPGNYTIQISQVLKENCNRSHIPLARKVEFLISKKNKRFPLPNLPAMRKVVEDITQRTCDSVTIEWWSSPGGEDSEYCIYLKKESRHRTFNFKEPIHCDLERSLKRDRYITHSFCLQRTTTGDEKLLRQRLVGLQPGTIYIVQVTVRRQNGLSLSYDLQQVSTVGTEDCQELE